jgi:hypothetical protein
MSCAVFADDSEGSVEFFCIPAEKKAKVIPFSPERDSVTLLGFLARGFLCHPVAY